MMTSIFLLLIMSASSLGIGKEIFVETLNKILNTLVDGLYSVNLNYKLIPLFFVLIVIPWIVKNLITIGMLIKIMIERRHDKK